jgi:N6-L-threonylcarbamoyladenine synthase
MLLGIETSCDETAAAVLTPDGRVLSSVIYSQIADHQPYGGVVPELASRCHVQALPGVVGQAMDEAGVAWSDLRAIAVTRGPGLATALLTGVAYARGLALRLGLPLFGGNHLVGHLQSIALAPIGQPPRDLLYPHLVLLVSGGHTCLVVRSDAFTWQVIGETLDDAAGEALDKGARLLGLGYPGGPEIERAGAGGNPGAIAFPRSLPPAGEAAGALPFSFSGLKTSLLYHLKRHPGDAGGDRLADTAASFEAAVVDALVRRTGQALELHPVRMIGCAGGVARNRRLRERLTALGAARGLPVWFAEPAYCADNAAMIAAAAQASVQPRHPDGTPVEVHPGLGLAADH